MRKRQQNFYADADVEAWIATLPARKKSREINAALRQALAQQQEQASLLDLLRDAVNNLNILVDIAASLAALVILMRGGKDEAQID